MDKHHLVDSGSCAWTQGPSFSAQYIGLMYSAVFPSKRFIPSSTNPIQVSTDTVGFRNSFRADSLIRAQWRSRSGLTPSNARAPSNTTEHSHAAWVRGPMMGTLPSCQSPSKNVQVFENPSPSGNSSSHCSGYLMSMHLRFARAIYPMGTRVMFLIKSLSWAQM